jgi:hypothetical protein
VILAAILAYAFQDKIIQLTFNEINKYLSTKIEIDKDVKLSIFEKFPEISIKVKNVKAFESYPGSTEKLAELKSLYFSFDAFELMKGNYVIKTIYLEKGDLRIRINENGAGNYFIFKTDSTATEKSDISFDLQNIIFEEVNISYVNQTLDQDHQVFAHKASSSLKLKDKSWFIGLKGDLTIDHIGISDINYFEKKSLRIQSNQEYHQEGNIFKILPSQLLLDGAEFKLSGLYEGDDKKNLQLDLKAEKSSISTLVSLLPEHLTQDFKKYESSGNVYFEAKVDGVISSESQPSLTVDFGFSNASFFHPDLGKKIEEATLVGKFSNGKNKNLRTSFLSLQDVQCQFDGHVITGNFSMSNFEDPDLDLQAKGGIDVKSLLQFYPITEIENADGFLDLDLRFKGRLADIKNSNQEEIEAEGSVFVKDLNMKIAHIPVSYSSINGSFHFNKNDLSIEELNGSIGNSDLKIKGTFNNFVNRIISGKDKLIVNASVSSTNLNLNELINATPHFSTKEAPKGAYPYLEDYKITLACDLNHFKYNKINAKNFKGTLEVSQPIIALKNVTFSSAGGKIELDGLAHIHSEKKIDLTTKIDLKQIRIDSIFYVCDNFNQDFIKDQNIKGEYTGSIKCFLVMDKNFDIKTETIIATIDASITNGQLINFEPMKKLSRFVDEKQLENIKFSELKNKIFMENNKIVIPEMEIKSNVSNISVLGTHSFNQEMDYKLAVPLKNFKKKQDKDEAFGAIEEDNKGNSILFLTVKGTTSNYKIAYDTKRTGKKIKEDLKKEKKELEQLFKKKNTEQIESTPNPSEYQFFDFEN